MSSSEAFVIWMLRIAMKAPIMLASTAIQEVRLAVSGEAAVSGTGWRVPDVPSGVVADMAYLQQRGLARPQPRRSAAEARLGDAALVSIVG
jgi:hypothetical protein